MRIMTFVDTEYDDGPLTVGRIGTTAEFGFFFLGDSVRLGSLKAEVREAAPDTADCGARIHHLLELETRTFNSDLDRPRGEHPLQAGCQWMIDFRKPDFVGAEAFRAAKEEGFAHRMVCLRLDDECAHAPTLMGEIALPDSPEPIGYVANTGWSPTLRTGVALAYLQCELAVVGLPVAVPTPQGPRPGRTVSAPFLITRSNAPRAADGK